MQYLPAAAARRNSKRPGTELSLARAGVYIYIYIYIYSINIYIYIYAHSRSCPFAARAGANLRSAGFDLGGP